MPGRPVLPGSGPPVPVRRSGRPGRGPAGAGEALPPGGRAHRRGLRPGAGEGLVPSRGRVLRVSDRPSGLELEVEVAGPGPAYLLVCRPLVATREATVDALGVAVDDANLGFSGLAVPKGRHVVRLRPRRGWLIIAAVISALALAATSFLCLRRRRGGVPGVTGLSRNTRRRLALYGGAALVAALALGVPPLVKGRAPRVDGPRVRHRGAAFAGGDPAPARIRPDRQLEPAREDRGDGALLGGEARLRRDPVRDRRLRPGAPHRRGAPRGAATGGGPAPPPPHGRLSRGRPLRMGPPSLRSRGRDGPARELRLRPGDHRHEGAGDRRLPRDRLPPSRRTRPGARPRLRRRTGRRDVHASDRNRLALREPTGPPRGRHGRLQRGGRQRGLGRPDRPVRDRGPAEGGRHGEGRGGPRGGPEGLLGLPGCEDGRGALPGPRRGPGLPRLRRPLALGYLGPSDERHALGRAGRPPRRGDPGAVQGPDARHVLLGETAARRRMERASRRAWWRRFSRAARFANAGRRCRPGPPGTASASAS